ncbi:MAG: MarR family winged helix-turn-helix transcriptional regulator [Lentihominibacter sp.]|jgi:DNA-binding MarR family transcriptional regulator
MDDFNKKFNRILVETYHHMLMTEETKRKYSSASFSFRDRNAIAYLMHYENGVIISDVAEFLKISRPSTTTLIKKLERYGLVERTAEPEDERSTLVKVTRKGRMFASYQAAFREELALAVSEGFTEEEKEILYRGFCKLNDFFSKTIKESEEIHK